MAEALRIAIIGAESTGKTMLARALGRALAQPTGRRVAVVAEVLREWCDARGRTPQAHEQAAILHAQHERIEAAAAGHDIVVCDTTALMTATYSQLVFGDRSLEAVAITLHRSMAATLLTALDLPWVADRHQRDGPHVRGPVDLLLRELLARHALPFHVIGGQGEARLQQALAALRPLTVAAEAGPRNGPFTGLVVDDGQAPGSQPRRWICECCVPEAERATRNLARR
jgi:nicotinamide riboside kinase